MGSVFFITFDVLNNKILKSINPIDTNLVPETAEIIIAAATYNIFTSGLSLFKIEFLSSYKVMLFTTYTPLLTF